MEEDSLNEEKIPLSETKLTFLLEVLTLNSHNFLSYNYLIKLIKNYKLNKSAPSTLIII